MQCGTKSGADGDSLREICTETLNIMFSTKYLSFYEYIEIKIFVLRLEIPNKHFKIKHMPDLRRLKTHTMNKLIPN